MPTPKGQHLFVNLGPTQTKRRLEGFGHGVRKVQSAGRNRSVVIHTATGRNLEELEAKFADIGFSSRESDLSEPIENLRNLGPASGAWLREVGIHTIADLQRLSPAVAFRLVKQQQPKASLNLLWAIAAGLKDIDWRELPEAAKERLSKEVKETE